MCVCMCGMCGQQVCVYMYVYVYVCVCVDNRYVYVYVCVVCVDNRYIYMYVWYVWTKGMCMCVYMPLCRMCGKKLSDARSLVDDCKMPCENRD